MTSHAGLIAHDTGTVAPTTGDSTPRAIWLCRQVASAERGLRTLVTTSSGATASQGLGRSAPRQMLVIRPKKFTYGVSRRQSRPSNSKAMRMTCAFRKGLTMKRQVSSGLPNRLALHWSRGPSRHATPSAKKIARRRYAPGQRRLAIACERRCAVCPVGRSLSGDPARRARHRYRPAGRSNAEYERAPGMNCPRVCKFSVNLRHLFSAGMRHLLGHCLRDGLFRSRSEGGCFCQRSPHTEPPGGSHREPPDGA
jgi:hypothetical protein